MAGEAPRVVAVKRVMFQLNVRDVQRAKRFYEELFGLEVWWPCPPTEQDWCMLRLPEGMPVLGLYRGKEGVPPWPNYQHGSMLSFYVEDLEGAREHLLKRGVETTEIFDLPPAVSYFNILDPDGNVVQIYGEARAQ